MVHLFDKFPTPEGTFFPLNLVTNLEIRTERLKTCNKCTSLKAFTLCSECNCLVQAKTWLNSAICPLNKWER